MMPRFLKIHIKSSGIKRVFKKTTPKNLAAKGKISSLAIQALKAIGIDKVTEGERKKILELLRREKTTDLEHDIRLAPEWIRKIMKEALTEKIK